MDRRAFLQTAAAAALATSLPETAAASPNAVASTPSALPESASAPYARAASTASPKYARAASTTRAATPNKKTIGIQVGAVSFVDEGTEKVLDNFQQYADVNTLFLATFTYGRGIAGRQIPGQPLPDHGKQQYDTTTFTGGNYATIHPQYYKNTVFHGTRATELGNYDVLANVIPAARKRNLKTICWFEDAFRSNLPNISALQEIDLSGNHADTVCFNNPNYRNFLLGIVEDWSRSYDIDGIMWCSERQGAFSNALGAEQEGRDINPYQVTCFCPFCIQKAKDRGINPDRARQGYLALAAFVTAARKSQRPVDGYYVEVWRLMLRYPELLALEMLWTDSLRETYAAIYHHVKQINPALGVGWHISSTNSFNPIYRAEQDLAALAPNSDFIKIVMYNNCAGERMAGYISSVSQTLYGDVPPQQLLDFHYRVLNYQEKPLAQIPFTGFSSDYVLRETQRSRAGLAGTNTLLWSGIDVDIPTEPTHSKCSPDGVRDAVLAAFHGNADGIILSRKYSEMKLTDLAGAQAALHQLHLAT